MRKSKEDIIQHKKQAIRKLNALMERYLSAGDDESLKKVDLLSYWLENYTDYIKDESSFSPNKLLRYSRGSIIRVNLGFRIGSEMGGLHYAVVIDNHNDRSANVITVIPLSSTDGRKIHKHNIDLGSELYSKAEAQRASLLEKAKKELKSVISFMAAMEIAESQIDLSVYSEETDKILQAGKQLHEKHDQLQKTIAAIEKYDSELSKMKSGSMAVVNQITTISKQRIYVPRKSEDFLYGVSLSSSAMEKINKKVSEMFLFQH